MLRWMLCALALTLGGCASLDSMLRPSIVKEAPATPVVPLRAPTQTMAGQKGDAPATYPTDFAATVKADGTIQFPQGTTGKIKGATIVVDGQPVISVGDDGQVKGTGLKKKYRFNGDGDLVDADGHGVRISAKGGVRALGGEWRSQDVFVWSVAGGGVWDKAAWRTLAIVALVMIENMLPQAITPKAASASPKDSDASKKDKGLYIPPPSEWFK
jgi:hypothetical protein